MIPKAFLPPLWFVMGKRKTLIQTAALALLVLFAYGNSLYNPFVFDDVTSISANRQIQAPVNFSALWQDNPTRVLANLSFALNYRFFGLQVFSWHLVNMGIHLGAVWTLYALVSEMLQSPVGRRFRLAGSGYLPFLVAALFAVHPMGTQAVSYIVQRTTSLAALFSLQSLWWYLRFRRQGWIVRYGFSLFFLVLALLTKEYAYILPVLIVFTDWFWYKTAFTRGIGVWVILLAVAGGVFFLSRPALSGTVAAPGASGSSTPAMSRAGYAASQISAIVLYQRLLLFPQGQTIDHSQPGVGGAGWSIAVLFHVSILLIAVYLLSRRPFISYGIFFFYLALIPESSVFPIADAVVEHRAYLASFGFLLALIAAICERPMYWHPRIFVFVFIPAVAIFTLLTIERNIVWGSSVSLWKEAVRYSPGSARAHFNLGGALITEGKSQEGLQELSKAASLDSSFVPVYGRIRTLMQ